LEERLERWQEREEMLKKVLEAGMRVDEKAEEWSNKGFEARLGENGSDFQNSLPGKR
jgi:hypothetical protein